MKTFTKVFLGIGLISMGLGIGLLILAAGSGATFRRGSTYSFDERYEGIRSMDIDIAFGEVNIVEGDEFRLQAEDLLETFDFEAEVVDGVWRISEKSDSAFNFFGVRFPAVAVFGEDLTPEITVTVPRGFSAEEMKLSLGAGSLKAEVLRVVDGSFQVDAGEMVINNLTVAGNSNYNVGAGYMNVKQIEANSINVDCGVGYIEMTGLIQGENQLICNIGKIKLDLDGRINEYSYDIDSDLGNVIINGKSYHNKKIRQSSGDTSKGSFLMDCDIGNITLEIN